MEFTRKTKIIIAAVAVATSFAAGRYSTPVKTKTETKIVEVEKKTDDKKVSSTTNKHVKTTVTETDKPDGSKVVSTVTQDDSVDKTVSDDKSTDSTKTDTEVTKEVSKGSSPVTVSVLAGVNVNSPSSGIVYGASVYKPVLGPIGVGVFGISSGQVGASVGLSF